MKLSPVCLVLFAFGCGISRDPRSTLAQGSGATGRIVAGEGPSGKPAAVPAGPRGNLHFSVAYDERSKTLAYEAWSREGAGTSVDLPGTLAADGLPFVREDDQFGTHYDLMRTGVEPQDQIVTELSYRGDGPDMVTAAVMDRIVLGDLGSVSLAHGMSAHWSGPALADGDEIELLFRVPSDDPERQNDSTAGSLWGKQGTPNTALWLDGEALRVPPIAAWTSMALTVGAKFEVRATRSRASDGLRYQAQYVSRDAEITVSP